MKDFEVPEHLVIKYLRNRRNDVDSARILVVERNYDRLLETAHNIKGTAISYGFQELENLSKKMEQSAQGKNTKDLLEQLNNMELWLEEEIAKRPLN